MRAALAKVWCEILDRLNAGRSLLLITDPTPIILSVNFMEDTVSKMALSAVTSRQRPVGAGRVAHPGLKTSRYGLNDQIWHDPGDSTQTRRSVRL